MQAEASQVQQHLRSAIFASNRLATGQVTLQTTAAESAKAMLLPDDPAFNVCAHYTLTKLVWLTPKPQPDLLTTTGLGNLPNMADLDINLDGFDFSSLSPISVPRFSTNLAFQDAHRMQDHLSPSTAPPGADVQLDLNADDLDLAPLDNIGFQVNNEGEIVQVTHGSAPRFGEAASVSTPSLGPGPEPLSPQSAQDDQVSAVERAC